MAQEFLSEFLAEFVFVQPTSQATDLVKCRWVITKFNA
ncbi:hypothetical protein SeGA_1794 [Salmonella enterica subsp. enterica serovar Gaminara str. A4-567]|nr:hypothetical protein SeGA_1794 [Salmonella enterica subsp. enterica serovar Gaminara str. A4-567]